MEIILEASLVYRSSSRQELSPSLSLDPRDSWRTSEPIERLKGLFETLSAFRAVIGEPSWGMGLLNAKFHEISRRRLVSQALAT